MVTEINPRLLGISGPLKGSAFPLPAGEVSIGRDSSNQLWVADPALSRRHCVLVQDGGGQFSIRDLKSRNGTLVNGVPVEQQQIRHGDQIFIGDSVLIFLIEEGVNHFDKNPVEFADTTEFDCPPLLLRLKRALPASGQCGDQPTCHIALGARLELAFENRHRNRRHSPSGLSAVAATWVHLRCSTRRARRGASR